VGDTRRAEREAAYARIPTSRSSSGLTRRGTADAHPHAHIHAARRARPVPALLQKRPHAGAGKV
jgi:hypothetical protein